MTAPYAQYILHLNQGLEFKRESANLVVDQNYTTTQVMQAMEVDLSTMMKQVKQLRDERLGKRSKAPLITPEQI